MATASRAHIYGDATGLPLAPIPVVDEVAYLDSAVAGALWTGSRLLLAMFGFLFGTLVFSYFYLRSINSHGLWRLPGQHPPMYIGVTVLVCTLSAAAVNYFGVRRLRNQGLATDWRVGTGVALLLILLGAGLTIWQLGRTHFLPGSSGFAGVFVAWQPVFAVSLLGAAYWLETLVARSIRLRWLLSPRFGDLGVLPPEVTSFRGSVDGCTVFLGFLSFVELVGFAMFFL